jgi:hypothetical protein
MAKIRSDNLQKYVQDLVSETFENMPTGDRTSEKEKHSAENKTYPPSGKKND